MLTSHPPEASSAKILFLDIDGVLNSAAWYARPRTGQGDLAHLDPVLVQRADEIARRTGAAIVISSAWRIHHPLEELAPLLRTAGLGATIIGKTPVIDDGPPEGLVRAAEILRWLEGHTLRAHGLGAAPVRRFAILDDLDDFGPLAPWHVCTSFEEGLTTADVERAVALLAPVPPAALRVT
jgi:hypothetical protein